MSVNDIKANIEKLEKSINSPTTPESFLPKLKGKKMELEAELKRLESAEKKEDNLEKILENTDKILKSKTASKTVKNTAKKKAQTAKKEIAKVKQVKETVAKKASTTKVNVKELLAGLSKDQKAFNRGRSKDEIQTDAKVKALTAGKRVSADGNVYYENRPNRSDVSTKRKPYLEDGGAIDYEIVEDFYIVSNEDGSYDVLKREGQKIKTFDTKVEAIEWANNQYAKGGKLSNKGAYLNEPQGGKYTRYEDSKESNRAKPAGWRYTNAGAKRLKLSSPNTYVTKAHLEKYRGKYFTDSKGVKHRYVYIERRADKSDIKRGFPYLERGGKLENYSTDTFKTEIEAEKNRIKIVDYFGDRVVNSIVKFGKDDKGVEGYQVFYDLKKEYAKGGSIPNNYERKTAEQVWNEWSEKQKQHFLADHADVIGDSDLGKWSSGKNNFENLSHLAQVQLSLHISQGQYEHGGEIDNMDIAENSALKVYVKPTKKEGIALFKQGEAVCVCHDDDTYEWHDEKDLLKMEDGEILSEIAEDKLEGTNINIFGYQTQNFDVSEHAAQYFNEGIAKIEELGSESAKESLYKAAEQLDIILSKVKEKEEDEFVLKSSTKVILNAIQLFAYNNYKCGLVIPIELLTNICSEILELNVDSEMVFEQGGEMYAKGGKLRSRKEYAQLVRDKYALVEKMTDQEVVDKWNEWYKERDIEYGQIGLSKAKEFREPLANKLIEQELTEEEYNAYYQEGGEMKWGGRTTFNEKVSAITDSLDGNKVKPKYQKQYGKTYDRKEARAAAQKIVGKLMSNENKKKTTK